MPKCEHIFKTVQNVSVHASYKKLAKLNFHPFIYRSNEDILQLIKDGEHEDIGAEKLRGFLKILPEIDELDMLKSFDGDVSRLGNAEKFLLQLLQIPK